MVNLEFTTIYVLRFADGINFLKGNGDACYKQLVVGHTSKQKLYEYEADDEHILNIICQFDDNCPQ